MDAHGNEYRAAAENLREQTPHQAQATTYADGDFVSGTSGGKRWAGRIERLSADGLQAVVDVGGGLLCVPVTDITH